MGYETEHWRQPTIQLDDKMIRSEHGRIVFNIDYRSHWFVLVQHVDGRRYSILVKYGGGEERFELPTVNTNVLVNIIASLSSDEAYLVLHKLYDIHREARRQAREETAKEYRQAFVDGRLKKRKNRGVAAVKVWIESAI